MSDVDIVEEHAVEPSDEQVANLASLVECDAAICRRALEQARGSQELAIHLIFDGMVKAPAPPQRPQGGGPAAARLALSAEQARVARVVEQVQRAAALAHEPASSSQPSIAGVGGPAGGEKPVREPPLLAKRPPKKMRTMRSAAQLARQRQGDQLEGYGPWTALQELGAGPCERLGSTKWKSSILAKDPPCLSLRGHKPVVDACWSTGEAHEFRDAPERLARVRNGKDERMVRDWFWHMLESVRYPPSELECAYRWGSLANNEAPPDLAGEVPNRPFVLLSNDDCEAAQQPPHFQLHPLRPEQLRSLAWMLAQESDNADAFGVEWRRYWTRKSEDTTGGADITSMVVGTSVRIRAGENVWRCDNTRQTPVDLINFPEHNLPGVITELERSQGVLTGSVFVEFSEPSSELPEVPCRFRCTVSQLQHIELPGPLEVGCLVRVSRKVSHPKFGWGSIDHNSLGRVAMVGGSDVRVQFDRSKRSSNWHGMANEMERVSLGTVSDAPPEDHLLDLRVRANYKVRGGILGDKIGFGKTATTIGLIDATAAAPLPPVPGMDSGKFIPAKGTLVIVPSNLFEQWLTEIAKFVWEGQQLKGKMTKGWSPKDCPLKIFGASDVRALSGVRAADLVEADVVLCSYRLLYSSIYLKRRKALAECSTARPHLTSALQRLADLTQALSEGGSVRVPNGRARPGTEDYVLHWQDLRFPVLEMFYWRRVVFDEFHELESFESQQQNILQHLRSHFRWGLTGTPPVDCTAGVVFMSSLFRIDLPGRLTRVGCRHPDLTEFEDDRLITEQAAKFLGHYVRQNAADLPSIHLESHTVLVRHSAAERALYLGQAHDSPDPSSADAFSTDEKVQALENLLKLCSHFQPGGESSADARQECDRLGGQRERRLTCAQNQIERGCRALLLLADKPQAKTQPECGAAQTALAARLKVEKSSSWLDMLLAVAQGLCHEGEAEAGAGARTLAALREVIATAQGEDLEKRARALEGHRPSHEQLVELLGPAVPRRGNTREQWAALASMTFPPGVLHECLSSLAYELATALRELRGAIASKEFFRQTLTALQGDSPEARSCSVCLEDDLPLTKLAITPCAHTFCMECLQTTVEKFKSCSICRQKLSPKDIRPVSLELKNSGSTPAAAGGSSASSSSTASASAPVEPAVDDRFHKYGTKLAVLVQKLQELRQEDPTAKAILFVQFDDLKRKVARVLTEFGVPNATLHGSTAQRGSIINDWQNNAASSTFVLLLSLAQSASGTNLTAASHVVFLHPMLAETAERAVGYEMQAIGRARRHGQQKSVVHVWRFVTEDTIEQQISERNQAALAAQETAPPPPPRSRVSSTVARASSGRGRGRSSRGGGRPGRGRWPVVSSPEPDSWDEDDAWAAPPMEDYFGFGPP